MSWEKPSRGFSDRCRGDLQKRILPGKLMGMISVQRLLLSGYELQLAPTRQHCPTGRCSSGFVCGATLNLALIRLLYLFSQVKSFLDNNSNSDLYIYVFLFLCVCNCILIKNLHMGTLNLSVCDRTCKCVKKNLLIHIFTDILYLTLKISI